MNKSKKLKWIILSVLAILIIIILVIGFNNKLQVDEYEYVNSKIPVSFDGYKIVQLSDLHYAEFGENNSELIETVEELEPDMIVFTGDMIDRDYDEILPSTINLIEAMAKLAPVYAVTGNHENDSPVKEGLLTVYEYCGVQEITDKQVKIEKDGEAILLTGLDGYHPRYIKIPKADEDYENMFNILLYHWADHFDELTGYGFDLVLSGHIHGGVIRLPFIGGLLGNDKTLFPKYSSGFYQIGDRVMLCNRGLGETSVFRFNNRPQVLLLTLKCSDVKAE